MTHQYIRYRGHLYRQAKWERYDLKTEAAKLNERFFKGLLDLNFPFRYRRIRKQYGLMKGKIYQNGNSEVTEVVISNLFNLDYDDFLGILAHELIHVYLVQNGDPKHGHGPEFRAEIDRIKQQGLSVPLSEDVNEQEMDIGKPFPRPIHAAIVDGDRIYVFRSFGTQQDLDDFIYRRIAYQAKLQNKERQLEFVTTTNPVLRHFKIARSLKTGQKVRYKLDPNIYEQLKPDIVSTRTVTPADFEEWKSSYKVQYKLDFEVT